MFIIGFITAAAGIAALIAAYQIRVKTLNEHIDQKTQLGVRNSQINDIQNRLELKQLEYETAVIERDNYKSGIDKITGSLVTLGVIHPDSDVLALTPADIIIEVQATPQPTATQPRPEVDITQLPIIPELTPQKLIDALTHAARKTKRPDRPFSRRYMRDNGPLNDKELKALVKYFLENGHLETESSNSPTLTESGKALIELVI